jgi:uncharacterized protein (TIGR00730 family)
MPYVLAEKRISAYTYRMKRICVFCGSSSGRNPEYARAAEGLGRELARQGIEIVYGGASIGLMGALADAALQEGGKVIGVIPEALKNREVAHKNLTRLEVVPSMHARKQLMESLSNAFIAMPGGFGTLDEFCEIVTWFQLGIHHKPFGLLNVAGFFDPFLAFIDEAVRQGFIREEHRAALHAAPDAAPLVARLLAR